MFIVEKTSAKLAAHWFTQQEQGGFSPHHFDVAHA
jgi:hypothetical protein